MPLIDEQNAVTSHGMYPNVVTEGRVGRCALACETADAVALATPERDAPLVMRITYPKAPGDYPVILFSHGVLGNKDGYQPLVRSWAEHGYVCVQPTHGDAITLRDLVKARREGMPLTEFFRSPGVTRHWCTRPHDFRTIMDHWDAVVSLVPALADRHNRAIVGMGGHSFGAHTAQMLAGLAVRPPADTPTPNLQDASNRVRIDDGRLKAFLAISPQGKNASIDADSWNGMTRPIMFMTGGYDVSPGHHRPASWRLEAFQACPAWEKMLVYFAEGHHDFGGISGGRFPGVGPQRPDHVAYARAVSLAFWDAQLKNDPVAKDYLTRKTLETATQGQVKIFHAHEPPPAPAP